MPIYIIFAAVSFPQLEELISPQCRPKPRISINEEKKYLKSCIFHGSSLMRSAQADINKRSYHKSYQEDSPETVGAQGGVLGDGVIEPHNLQTGGVDLNLKG